VEQTGRARSAIVGGVDDTGDPAVVELLVDGEGECTASIIAPTVALTAAHCIAEADAGATFAIFTGWNDDDRTTGEVVTASAAHVHPSFDPDDDESTADIAVVILSRPVAIAPLPYNATALDASLVGKPVRMIGYGDNTVKDPTSGFGKRRQATSPLISFDGDWVVVGTKQKNQCYGDSGGPVLMTIGGVETIVGVDSFQENDDCNSKNHNTRVDAFKGFVDMYVASAGADGGAPLTDGGDVPATDAGAAAAPASSGATPARDGGAAADGDAGAEEAAQPPGGCSLGAPRGGSSEEGRSSPPAGVLLAISALVLSAGARRWRRLEG